MRSWLARLMMGALAGCGGTPEPMSNSNGQSTGSSGETTTPTGGTTAQPTGSTTADPTNADTSGTEAGSTDTSTGEPPPEPTPWECTTENCATECHRDVPEQPEPGEVCWCKTTRPPDEWIECELPLLCENDEICAIQALRYAVPGLVSIIYDDPEFATSVFIEILGNGQARHVQHDDSYNCCGGIALNTDSAYSQVFDVIAMDDPLWAECLGGSPWDCLELSQIAATCTDAHLTECPDVPRPDPAAPCEVSCPMADDGVCDEPTGTGLCPEGCDPVDCAR